MGSARSADSALYVVVPGDLDTRTGGYGYDRRIIGGLRARGWLVEIVRLDEGFPVPSPAARAHAADALTAIPDGSLVLADGLAIGALPEEAQRDRDRLRIIALVHHPLADETGLDTGLAAALEISERRALAAARAVVVTSRATAARIADFGVAADRIFVVEPGTDPAPIARGSAANSPDGGRVLSASARPKDSRATARLAEAPEARRRLDAARGGSEKTRPAGDVALLCVATLTPRKGYEILLDALAAIPYRDWRLTCAGSLDRDPPTVARVRARVRDSGLEDRVRLAGDLDAVTLAAEYDRADLFVLPTLYEGYGMAVAEALARGLPVVSTATGSIENLVLGTGVGRGTAPAGIVVAPGDLPAFTAALSRAIGDPVLRASLAANARAVRDRLATWDVAAGRMERALERAARIR